MQGAQNAGSRVKLAGWRWRRRTAEDARKRQVMNTPFPTSQPFKGLGANTEAYTPQSSLYLKAKFHLLERRAKSSIGLGSHPPAFCSP